MIFFFFGNHLFWFSLVLNLFFREPWSLICHILILHDLMDYVLLAFDIDFL